MKPSFSLIRSASFILLILVSPFAMSGTLTIGALVSGQIDAFYVKTGQSVSKGQKLLKIDDDQWQAKLQQATAKMKMAELEMKDARLELDQALDLFDRTVTSKRTLDAAQLNFDKAEQHFLMTQASVDQVKSQQKYYHIVAPRKGTVKRILKSMGSTVYKENTPMIEIEY